MDDKEIIRSLNQNFVSEIEASMIYMRNALLMKDCVPSRLTEAIAIDEMRHMNWLADLIVKKGGVPSMEYKELDFGYESLKVYLQKQCDIENNAVKQYQE